MQEHICTDMDLLSIYGGHHLCTVEEGMSPCACSHDMQDFDMTLGCHLASAVACGDNAGIQRTVPSRW
jgi:hypothetical protein